MSLLSRSVNRACILLTLAAVFVVGCSGQSTPPTVEGGLSGIYILFPIIEDEKANLRPSRRHLVFDEDDRRLRAGIQAIQVSSKNLDGWEEELIYLNSDQTIELIEDIEAKAQAMGARVTRVQLGEPWPCADDDCEFDLFG